MKKKKQKAIVMSPFIQSGNITISPSEITATKRTFDTSIAASTVQLYLDKKGRLVDHNGKRILTTLTGSHE